MISPAIAVSPTSQDFGTIQVGTTAERTFYVTNSGGGILSGSATVPAPFSIVSGGTYDLAANASQAVVMRYSPAVAGTNNATVTFTGGAGATPPVVGAAYSASPPVAGFTGSPTNGAAPLTVLFTNLSSGATGYSWDFGGGKTSTVVNPANTYTNAGSYTVRLTAIGAGGTNRLARTNYIVVTPPVSLAFGPAEWLPHVGVPTDFARQRYGVSDHPMDRRGHQHAFKLADPDMVQ